MDIQSNWSAIRAHFRMAYQTNFHYSIATVSQDGIPCVTPIGSLFLNDDLTGFYFEKYPKSIPTHAQTNTNICVLAVNSNKWYWLKALWKGQFKDSPAIKLYGQLGAKRAATAKEITRLQRRMKLTKKLKGHAILWGKNMNVVREISFSSATDMRLGKMYYPTE